jgi:hypothetical protein
MKIIDKFKNKINGVLSGFDRIILKGHLRQLFSKSGKGHLLSQENVLLKDFGLYAEKVTASIKSHVEEYTQKNERPLIYLNSSKVSKENTAKDILEKDPVSEGLICVISTVELCKSVDVRKNKETGKPELTNGNRKCLYYYFYYMDKEFGFMHVKLQTWFPFEIQVYVNGREYIGKQLDKIGIGYKRYDNSFLDIDDIQKAQEISDSLQGKDMSNMLDHFAHQVNPFLTRLEEIFHCGYFWCLDQSEYATDVMFKSRSDLETVYKDYLEHAIISFKSNDVMTFMGRKMHSAFSGEIVSDIKKRPQGFRIKHRMKKNSIKMYDKYSVLRVETTINDPREFKVYKEIGKDSIKRWVPMGKSISNLYRYAQVCEAANRRYFDAVALADLRTENIREVERLCYRVQKNDRVYSGFNTLSKETENLFIALFDAGNHINGFTNASLRKSLFPHSAFDDIKTRNKVTRLLSKLRAHKLISKIPHSTRYKLTPNGIRIISATLIIKNYQIPKTFKAS